MSSRDRSQRFQNQVALVTGGTSGIGRATAIAFAREGAKVVVAGRRDREGDATVRSIADAGGAAIFVHTDVARETDVAAFVARALEHFGRLDVAFNNAGTLGAFGHVVEQTASNFDRVFDINVRGIFFALKHEIPAMLRTGGGAIVNMSATGGSIGYPNLSFVAASKHAVIGLTKSVALEYARQNIRVNAVSPAGIQTDLLDQAFGVGENDDKRAFADAHPVGRIGTADEVADAVLYLSAPGSAFVTGHDLLIDGGYTAR